MLKTKWEIAQKAFVCGKGGLNENLLNDFLVLWFIACRQLFIYIFIFKYKGNKIKQICYCGLFQSQVILIPKSLVDPPIQCCWKESSQWNILCANNLGFIRQLPFPTYRHFLTPLQQTTFDNIHCVKRRNCSKLYWMILLWFIEN